MKVQIKLAALLLAIISGIEAIKQDYSIQRVSVFSGAPYNYNPLKEDTSIVKTVEPLKMSTLVQTLFEHSIKPRDDLKSYYDSARMGKMHFGLHSNSYLAQREMNVLIQDYLPMNEADMASAMFMFSFDGNTCRLAPVKDAPIGVNPCHYHGARFLSDIVRRVSPIHTIMTYGNLFDGRVDLSKATKTVPMKTPPEWNAQIARMVANLGSGAVQTALSAVDSNSGKLWEDIKAHVSKQAQMN